jgi:hypothetical protein
MSTALRDGIQRLEVTSRVSARCASSVAASILLNGNSTVGFFAAVI